MLLLSRQPACTSDLTPYALASFHSSGVAMLAVSFLHALTDAWAWETAVGVAGHGGHVGSNGSRAARQRRLNAARAWQQALLDHHRHQSCPNSAVRQIICQHKHSIKDVSTTEFCPCRIEVRIPALAARRHDLIRMHDLQQMSCGKPVQVVMQHLQAGPAVSQRNSHGGAVSSSANQHRPACQSEGQLTRPQFCHREVQRVPAIMDAWSGVQPR